MVKNGRVYWITGLPGSGKTTVGTALFYRLREQNDNIIILDGDILKQFVGILSVIPVLIDSQEQRNIPISVKYFRIKECG